MNDGGDSGAAKLPIEYIPTADHARIACLRRPTPGGQPVIFLHGLAANARLWDLPDIEGEGFHYRSLAAMLHDAGYDIWLVNLRGHGGPHMLSEPAPGQTDWCVDHFILFDLPAVVDHVQAQTGRRPFAIGASMGSMTLGGYVQGAVLEGAGAQAHIVADPTTARARQEQLAGCVFAEFPAALRWPDSAYDKTGGLQWRELVRDWWGSRQDANYSFELLSRWGWLLALLDSVGEVPLRKIGSADKEPWYRKLPAPLAEGMEKVERSVTEAILQLAGAFTGATDHRAEVVLQGRRYVMDHLKSGVMRQMAKGVRAQSFVSILGTPDHVYSDHYELIELPTLVLQGQRDRIANADVTREVLFERLSSTDKTYRLYDEIAHGEIEAAPIATERIYPEVLEWLQAHWTGPRSEPRA